MKLLNNLNLKSKDNMLIEEPSIINAAQNQTKISELEAEIENLNRVLSERDRDLH